MKNNKALNFLGLAFKAGKVISGNEIVVKAIQKKQVYLVLVANDASDNTKKKIIDKCTYYNVSYRISFNGEELGNSIGKSSRKVVAVTDQGFSNKLKLME